MKKASNIDKDDYLRRMARTIKDSGPTIWHYKTLRACERTMWNSQRLYVCVTHQTTENQLKTTITKIKHMCLCVWLEVLAVELSFAFGEHGVEYRLTFGHVSSAQFIDLSLHL